MDKFFKHFGINLKKNSTDHVSSSSNIPQELNESTLALSKDKYCGWSALIDFPLKYNSRRNSEIAHRLASHDLDCNKSFLVIAPEFSHEHQCREHIYLNSARPKVPRTRASICFDSFTPKLLDFYSDPADLKLESSVETKAVNLTEDVFSEDEDYTVPYQPSLLQKCKTFGSEKDLYMPQQENPQKDKTMHGKLTSTSNLCLSKYKIRKCSDITYDEPWDLNHTKRDLVGKLEATFSSNPALRPVNSEGNETTQARKSSERVHSPFDVQKRKLLRVHGFNEGNVGGKERCCSSKASRENVPSRALVQNLEASSTPLTEGCHCRHPSHRMTWQGVEQVAILPNTLRNFGKESLLADKNRGKNLSPPRQQIKISSEALERQSWYHGALGRLDAENLLKDKKAGSFLVRASESNKKDFSLSLKSEGGLLHIKIVKENDQFILGQFSQPFESIPSIIKFFTVNKLPVRGTHHILLTNPIEHVELL